MPEIIISSYTNFSCVPEPTVNDGDTVIISSNNDPDVPVEVSITPNAGYCITSIWSAADRYDQNGTSESFDCETGTITRAYAPSSDGFISITTHPYHTVTVVQNMPGGTIYKADSTISVLGETKVADTFPFVLWITPYEHYGLYTVSTDVVCNNYYGSFGSPITLIHGFYSITSDMTISVRFGTDGTLPHTITIGTTTGGTTTHDDNLISIIPDDGYFICGVYLDTVSIGLPNTYEVTEDGHTLGVTFCKTLRPIWQASPLGKMSGNSSPLGI